MSNKQASLVVWWPNSHDQARADSEGRVLRVRFEVHGAGGKLHGGEEPLNQLPKDLPCVALVAPSEVTVLSVTPPKLTGQKLQDALPFVVEPFLLNDPEDNHVSLWHSLGDGQRLAAVVGRAHVRAVVTACRQAGLQLQAVSCETLRQPSSQDRVLWFSGNDLLVAEPAAQPAVLPTTTPAVLTALLQRVLGNQSGVMLAADRARLEGLTGTADILQSIETVPRLPLSSLNQLRDCSLVRPEELRRLGVRAPAASRGKRSLLVAFIGLLAVGVVGLNMLAFKARSQNARLEQTIAERYAQALPDTPMVADPLLLIEREKRTLSSGLAGNNSSGSASHWLHEVGVAMQDAPFNSLNDLAFSKGTLSLRFGANVTQAMQEGAVQRLKARGLSAQWTKAGPDNQPVLQVKQGDPS
ncbi:MAG TPA: type II secretion system protein GspL [Limnobacter sp.]|uniref:type II secretion system protein GspL n=1 Tax=Limnobacter sp. TaxID=2003368 RepID=UPI002EDB1D6A